MIRVAVLDDHPAVLDGLARVLTRSDAFEPVAFVESDQALLRTLDVRSADVVVVDYEPLRGAGLEICQRCKEHVHPPRVVVYSMYAGPTLAVAARLAGADGLVAKSDPVAVLLAVLTRVAAGETVIPKIALATRHAVMQGLEDVDRAIAAMLLADTPRWDIAHVLDMRVSEVHRRSRRLVAGLGSGRPAHEERPTVVQMQPASVTLVGNSS